MTEKQTILIKRATPADAEAVSMVQRQTWLDTYPNETHGISKGDIRIRVEGEHGELIPQKVERWRQIIADNPVFVAWLNGKVVGFASPRAIDDKPYVGAVYVLPEVQTKGIGTKLLQKVLDWHGGKNDIYVHVASYNEKAINFYQKFGFEKTGRAPKDDVAQLRNGKEIPEIEMVRKAGP